MYDSQAPRRPFNARGSRVQRCQACLMAYKHCICDDKYQVAAKAEFLLLSHHDELFKPTNTGRLIVDSIAATQVHEWSRTAPSTELLVQLQDPNYQPYIVFPEGEDYQQRMVSEVALPPSAAKPLFIILDGTWRQARRMFRLSPYLQQLPVYQPPPGYQSGYRMRQAAEQHHLCTAEVAAAVLDSIGDSDSAAVLQHYFEIFNCQYAMSKRTADLHQPLAVARQRLSHFKHKGHWPVIAE